ncbi:hypothetical protein F4553_005857 [Allocatelliglobosispora scoriae]|uniref:WD40 repeat domain-containing protein n=1 Tax=Allocatelliglobosispora scoriae TaxID=643052 RepID=A0A841BZV8_9ACTN|nr:PD40 domain-containing protein [Allocatelliglobosispora scoriae]MBB5872423.1 hypothetical protein [Allocatelliglobosispora scoriae]
MNKRHVGIALIVALVLGGAGYVTWRALPSTEAQAAPLDLTRPGTLIAVSTTDQRVRQTAPSGTAGTGPACQRSYAAAGTLICLRSALPMGFQAAIFDREMVLRKTIDLWGTPSRARVSPSGRLVAWTVFHSGDSYLRDGEFSTIAGVYDLSTGEHYGSLEDFSATINGVIVRMDEHVNYWGITFAADDRTFYATMALAGRTWLVRGDLVARTLVAIGTDVECPSLSPDGTRIAYKKRVAGGWRLHVAPLAGFSVTGSAPSVALAEVLSVDDQPAWADETTVAYGVNGAIYAVPADGSGAPTLLRSASSSPSFP